MALYSAGIGNAGFLTLVSFNKSLSASPTYSFQSFAHSFDSNTKYYLVHVNMYRTSTSDNQVFYGTVIDEFGLC